jgi:hypothetical protein
MKPLLLSVAALLFLPSVVHSQAIPFYQHGPIASLTASASYIDGEPTYGHNHSFWGWSASPQFNFTRHISMAAEVDNSYESSITPGERRLFLTAGPKYTFDPIHRVRPFVFAEGGEVRLTFTRSTYRDWDPVAETGAGFEYYLPRGLSFTVVPVEWIAHNLDAGGWENDFSARAGFTINFFARHHGD